MDVANKGSSFDVSELASWEPNSPFDQWPRDLVMVAVLGVLGLCGLLVVSPALGLAALLATAVFIGGIQSTSVAVGGVLLSVPIQDLGAVSLGSAELTVTKIVVGAACLAWLYRVLAEPGFARFDVTAAFLVALVAALMASVINAQNLGAWAGEVYRWAIALLVYLMATSAIRERWFPEVLLGATAIGIIAMSVVGIGQVLTDAGPRSFESRGLTRAYATFGEPNPFAGYLEMTVPVLTAFVLFRRREGPFRRRMADRYLWLLAVGAVGCGGVALMLTQSRGGLLGMIAGLFVILALHGGWMRRAAFGGIILAMAVLVVTPLGPRAVATAFGTASPQQVNPSTFAVQERLAHWRTGLAMVREHPILGVGAGNFTERYREFAEVWRFRISRGHAHNTYIHIAAQAGFIGLACYLSLLGAVIWRLARAFQRCAGTTERAMIAGALGVTGAVMIHGVFDYLHVLSLGLQLSVVWALANLGAVSWREPES